MRSRVGVTWVQLSSKVVRLAWDGVLPEAAQVDPTHLKVRSNLPYNIGASPAAGSGVESLDMLRLSSAAGLDSRDFVTKLMLAGRIYERSTTGQRQTLLIPGSCLTGRDIAYHHAGSKAKACQYKNATEGSL